MRDLFVAIGTHPLFPVASVLVGAFITWVVAWWYFKRSGDELRREADSLHKATSLIFSYLENQQADVKVQRDSKGRVSGLIVGASGIGRLGNVTGNATLTDGSANKS